MADEDLKFREYLEQHGYDTSQMGLTSNGTDSSSDYDEKKDAGIIAA